MNNIHTLVGKSNYLFLINDSNKSLLGHTENVVKPQRDKIISKHNIENYYLIVYPDKEVVCKEFLPDNIKIKYRSHLDMYKSILKKKVLDPTNILDPTDYYKTDSHINIKGNIKIYNFFMNFLKLKILDIDIEKIEIDALNKLGMGIGDLTWESNKKNLVLENISDSYFKLSDKFNFYCSVYKEKDNFKILDYNFNDNSSKCVNKLIGWDIISANILYKKTLKPLKNNKVVIFYDSFLLPIIGIYKNIFGEIYLIKNSFDKNIIEKIKPDLIFEFRAERFL